MSNKLMSQMGPYVAAGTYEEVKKKHPRAVSGIEGLTSKYCLLPPPSQWEWAYSCNTLNAFVLPENYIYASSPLLFWGMVRLMGKEKRKVIKPR